MSRSNPRRGAARSRRRFLQDLGAASAAVPLVGLLPGLVQGAPSKKSPPKVTPPPPPPPPPAATPPANEVDPQIKADAKDLLEIVKRRYGSRLDAKQLDEVRDDLEGLIQSGRALRKLELRNADEPSIVFRAEAPGV